jgi:hypothetical protein
MLLKRTYGLLALVVCLDTSGSEAEVVFDLEVHAGGHPETVARWRAPARAIGVPDRLDRSTDRLSKHAFHLPHPFAGELADWLRQQADDDQPLWLHLRKPYGYLGCVPWEGLLVPELGRPILRLPDFFERPPLETPRALEVALCCSTPDDERAYGQNALIDLLLERTLGATDRPMRVHVFTDSRFSPALAARAGSGPVVVHSRATVPEASDEHPWFAWMRRSLGGRSVDVVHFMGHGYVARGRGSLALAASPQPHAPERWSTFVSDAEVDAFLTSVGAWGAAFSAAEGNYSELGLRLLADSLALRRPGAFLFHDWESDPQGYALADAYRFLYSVEPQVPPASGAVFMYCQPFRVARPARTASAPPHGSYDEDTEALPEPNEEAPPAGAPPFGLWGDEEEALAEGEGSDAGTLLENPDLGEAAELVEAEENVPGWLATTARFLEQEAFQLQAEREGGPLADTLRQIESVMLKHARTR